jgi:hypothetical protein
VTLPAAVTTNLDFDLKSTFWTVAGSYRLWADQNASLDLLAGARLADVKQSLEWEFLGSFGPNPPPPRTGKRSASTQQWDAIIGAKGRYVFGANGQWVVPYYADIGAGDSDLTWQAMTGIGRVFGWGQLSVVWRYLDYELDSEKIESLNFNGPAIGATFLW